MLTQPLLVSALHTGTAVVCLPPPFRTDKPIYYDDPQGSEPWKETKKHVPQSGSTVSGYVALSPPYRDGKQTPQFQYRATTGTLEDGETTEIEQNEHLQYGSHYESRGRNLFNAIMRPCEAKEYAFFQDAKRPKGGMSPDGLTNAIRILCSMPDSDQPPRWIELGQTALEQKASKQELYSTPKVPHITQLQWQMHIIGMRYGWLLYWHGDKWRVWIVEYNADYIRWIERRLDLFDWHVDNRIPITLSHPYFQWKRKPEKPDNAYKNSVADYLGDLWFAPESNKYKPTRPLRKPIDVSVWPEELAHLESAPRRGDAAQLFAPPKPNIWLVYEQTSVPDQCRLDAHPMWGRHPLCPGNGEVYPPDLPDDDPWFRKWPTVSDWASGVITENTANTIQRLHIHAIEEMTNWVDCRPSQAAQSLHFHASSSSGHASVVPLFPLTQTRSLCPTAAPPSKVSKKKTEQISKIRCQHNSILSVVSSSATAAAPRQRMEIDSSFEVTTAQSQKKKKRSLALFLQDLGTNPVVQNNGLLWDDGIIVDAISTKPLVKRAAAPATEMSVRFSNGQAVAVNGKDVEMAPVGDTVNRRDSLDWLSSQESLVGVPRIGDNDLVRLHRARHFLKWGCIVVFGAIAIVAFILVFLYRVPGGLGVNSSGVTVRNELNVWDSITLHGHVALRKIREFTPPFIGPTGWVTVLGNQDDTYTRVEAETAIGFRLGNLISPPIFGDSNLAVLIQPFGMHVASFFFPFFGSFTPSDERIKVEQGDFVAQDSLDFISQLTVHQYRYSDSFLETISASNQESVNPMGGSATFPTADTLVHGLFAQEVADLAPLAVAQSPMFINGTLIEDFNHVRYEYFIPDLIAAVQALSGRVAALEEELLNNVSPYTLTPSVSHSSTPTPSTSQSQTPTPSLPGRR